jgi:membrane protein YdbS with pleckstrin-like domain
MDQPGRTLSPLARWVWRLQQVGLFGALTVVGAFVAGAVDGAAPWAWLGPLVALVLAVLLIPPLRWRRWRWDVRDEGIDIQHGTFTIRRTLIPWVRVQHVDTRRGLLEQAFNLATVVVHTAAAGHTIPMLSFAEAAALRDRIAGLARTEDDDHDE